MDRPVYFGAFRLAGAAILATVALAAGCRSTRSEVPPGKPYARTGEAPPTVGFSSQPHPGALGMPGSTNIGPGGMADDPLAATQPQYGTPTPGSRGVTLPTGNRYGPPGTSGLDPSAGAGPSAIADSLMEDGKSVSKSLADDAKLNKASATSPY
jgi:hypothetical protein